MTRSQLRCLRWVGMVGWKFGRHRLRLDGVGVKAHRDYCYRCFKPAVACICASVARVLNRTGITILQHPRERFHAIGTVRIARLGLANVRVQTCAPRTSGSGLRARIPEGAALLYPVAGACELASLPAAERPRHLVVLDGTWFHARKIYQHQQWLAELPHVRLTPEKPSEYRIRPEPTPSCLATLEAIVAALRILEPNTRGLDGLLRCFSAMVDRQASFTPGACVDVSA